MGCNTCKSKKKNKKGAKDISFEKVDGNKTTTNTQQYSEDDNSMLKGLADMAPQGIAVKSIMFCALLVAIPLFAVYLLFYIFATFFFKFDKKSNGLSVNGLLLMLTYPSRKWRQFRSNLKERNREKQFSKNIGYSSSEIDVLIDKELVEKSNYSGEVELAGVELLVNNKKGNNNV